MAIEDNPPSMEEWNAEQERINKNLQKRRDMQKKIGGVGKKIREECTGLTGKKFTSCRIKVIESIFKKEKKE